MPKRSAQSSSISRTPGGAPLQDTLSNDLQYLVPEGPHSLHTSCQSDSVLYEEISMSSTADQDESTERAEAAF
jgi:hypothetical protein